MMGGQPKIEFQFELNIQIRKILKANLEILESDYHF